MVLTMNAWIVRGFLLGALVVALRVALGFAMANWPTHGIWFRLLCLLVLLGAIVAWGALDGGLDRRAHPDPARGSDLTIRWLQAAALGGIGSSAVCWILDLLPGIDLGDNGVLFELTACSAFFLLLIFVPGLAGIGVGRMLAGRSADKGGTAAARPAPAGA